MATQWTAGLVDGTPLPAATLNQIGAAWETWTPVLKQGATTLTTSVTYSKYARVNKNVFIQVSLLVQSAGAANGIITCSYPTGLAPANNGGYRALGSIILFDSGVALYSVAACVYDTTTFSGFGYNSASYIGASAPAFTFANGDRFEAAISYEVA